MKKYRLKIPDMISKEDAWKADLLKKIDVVEDNFKIPVVDGMPNIFFSGIPKDWLEEIKDEPVSAEDYMDYIEGLDAAGLSFQEVLDINKTMGFREKRLRHLIRQAVKDGMDQGEANNELRHRPKQSFESWSLKNISEDIPKHMIDIIVRERRFAWQASEKNRGFDV